ncbi:growth-regulating factor 6-like isoform X1 [Phoenix dactylifera]|uniref:Growth-regulating factor n=1 Tax=Phoenix dactylifera TaxID=42345 RepID=A0A8B7CDN9_PHODC|nr:growth-regulating factor 6-like isoform X1 [Phoenix dactylifera]
MDGLVGASSLCGGVFSSPQACSDHETNKKNGFFRSGLQKQGRPCGPEEHDWRYLKVARTEVPSLSPDGEQMLSFSSSKPDAFLFSSEPRFASTPSASSYVGNAGLISGSLVGSMHGVLAGARGPFTPSQWLELEQQALIYKYMNANAPIPASLLISIRRSLSSSRFTSFSAGSLGPNTFRWGSLHLGLSGNADAEPGRCRRTDGKKWRCSRDAVADQKYCERHMNRGRHRSRKPVEGQNGHAAKAMPVIAPTPTAPAVSCSGSSNSFTVAQQQINNGKPSITCSSSTQFDRVLANKELDNSHDLSMLNSVNSEPTETLLPIPEQHNPFEESPSRAKYVLVSSDSPFKPPSNSYLGNDNFVSSTEFNDLDPPTNPLRHFIDEWHRKCSNSSTITWPEREMTSDQTQLSISIPVASSDFSSSSSPTHDKYTPSPLKLSLDSGPDSTNLGVGNLPNYGNQRQASWVPSSWESSMGGPLGEVLNNTCITLMDHNKNCSSLNLMPNGDDFSPWLRSSPTGVLHKTNFGSLSSSTRSSPIAENHNHNVQDNISSLHENLLGTDLVDPSTITSS